MLVRPRSDLQSRSNDAQTILRLLRNYYGQEKESSQEEEALSALPPGPNGRSGDPLEEKAADLFGGFFLLNVVLSLHVFA